MLRSRCTGSSESGEERRLRTSAALPRSPQSSARLPPLCRHFKSLYYALKPLQAICDPVLVLRQNNHNGSFDKIKLPQGHLHRPQLRVRISLPLPTDGQLTLDRSDHIAELNNTKPKQPFFFLKPSSSILYPGEGPVLRPKGTSLHYEVELALVMGKKVRDLDPNDDKGALDAIQSQ